MTDLVMPGRQRGTDEKYGEALEVLYGLWIDMRPTPMGLMRQDAYFALLESVLELYMQHPPEDRWDNRRVPC